MKAGKRAIWQEIVAFAGVKVFQRMPEDRARLSVFAQNVKRWHGCAGRAGGGAGQDGAAGGVGYGVVDLVGILVIHVATYWSRGASLSGRFAERPTFIGEG